MHEGGGGEWGDWVAYERGLCVYVSGTWFRLPVTACLLRTCQRTRQVLVRLIFDHILLSTLKTCEIDDLLSRTAERNATCSVTELLPQEADMDAPSLRRLL